MKALAIVLLLLPLPAMAGPYIEVGIAKADGGTCIADYLAPGVYGCSESPLGSIAIGYQWRGFSIEVEHYSSFENRDRGLNLLSLRYRWEFGK